MNDQHAEWNARHQALRQALAKPQTLPEAIGLFMSHHAALHAFEVAPGPYSFEEELWDGLSPTAARCIPTGSEHSIAWNLWHLARIEDVTMNVLLAGGDQELTSGGWLEQLAVPFRHTGNSMPPDEIAALSTAIDLPALRAYRSAVGRRTRAAVQTLTPAEITQKVQPERLQRLLDEGAVVPAAQEVLAYWGGLTLAGLLLMPPTRHNFIHINESMRLKQKCRKV
ncbi:MAG TPA: DinB family protein [Anaerolineaceae bacterium]|nr:DinB family protein [Anaerolineaceae bacterium]HPN53320.1 DinB family protein [Anaerolineaceae bacterium]